MGFPASAVLAGFTPDTGYLNELTPADPAAGANLTVPLSNARWTIVHSVLVTLTTDNNVANRLLYVDYLARGGLAAMRNGGTAIATASNSGRVYQFDNQHVGTEAATNTMVFQPLYSVPLQAGWQVRVTVDNIQAGDTLTSCKLLVTEFYASDDDNC